MVQNTNAKPSNRTKLLIILLGIVIIILIFLSIFIYIGGFPESQKTSLAYIGYISYTEETQYGTKIHFIGIPSDVNIVGSYQFAIGNCYRIVVGGSRNLQGYFYVISIDPYFDCRGFSNMPNTKTSSAVW